MTRLEIEALTVRYGGATAVDGLSLTVDPGEIVVMLGPNGAGKTSTLRAIAGLVRSVRGRVTLDGTSILGWRPHRVAAARLSLVPQGRRVFASLTVEENLRLGGYKSSKSADQRAILARCYAMFPILEVRKNERAGFLSGGEQQMLAFGRALMAQPDVILMDEPSMGLAPIIISRIMEHAKEICEGGIGVLMAEQNAAAALKVADRVVVLSLGRSAYTGSAADARRDPSIAKAFLGEHYDVVATDK
jgi:branched-chain amino acid transport system ATP-binding protein